MTSDGAENRFWIYFDTTTPDASSTTSTATINNAAPRLPRRLRQQRRLGVYTCKAGNPNGYTTNAYTPVGTYATGWTEYRLVHDFTTQTYTLSSRANAATPGRSSRPPAPPATPSRCSSASHRQRHPRHAVEELPRRAVWVDDAGATRTPASPTCSAPTPSPPRPVRAARSRLSAPAPSPTAPRRPSPSRRHPATQIADVLVDGVSVGAPSHLHVHQRGATTPSRRRSRRSPSGRHAHHRRRLRQLPRRMTTATSTTLHGATATLVTDGHPARPLTCTSRPT